MTLRVQLICTTNQECQRAESIEWVIGFMHNLSNHYEDDLLNKLELLRDETVLNFDADIFIKTVSKNQIKVGFRLSLVYVLQPSDKVGMHWITITDASKPSADTVSKFLLILIGLIVLPNSTGGYNTDFSDIATAMQMGNHGTLINLEAIDRSASMPIQSVAVWFNSKGQFMANFYQVCNTLDRRFKGQDVVPFVNVTDYIILKQTGLALLVH